MSDRITGRIFIEAKLRLIYPLQLGSGEDTFSDSDLMRDAEGHPMIPATSFVGALQSYINQRVRMKEEKVEKVLHYLFPNSFQARNAYSSKESLKNKPQSHFIVDDLHLTSRDYQTTVRDGVRIEHATNTAADQGKYDYELLEGGATFDFNAEVILRKGMDKAMVRDTIQLLHQILGSDNNQSPFQVGALTSHGFGQLELVENSWKVYDFFEGASSQYFKFLNSNKNSEASPSNDYSDKPKHYEIQSSSACIIDMTLRPTTPFKIGGGTPETGADDASLQANGDYILSAKSMKGAVRHHAYRIANTIHENPNKLINALFGSVEDNELSKSRFWTSDASFCKTGDIKEQTRVAIDRFTGGAMESALFQTEPVWPTDETTVSVKWKILHPKRSHDDKKQESHEDAEIGLLLLVARDLMTEFLAVGGEKAIGRGRFRGISATIKIGDRDPFKLKSNEDEELSLEDQSQEATLNKYINAFLECQPNKKNESNG
ncbi:MAG TPA: RAMP superfamily CRISPR-associated protein [Bacteroidales bacterium]|nr:RAMP superfamily CRISPR-associated protein [Bacteroidales bacterium]HKL03687.1 RAMP superfamily CRISPR-associated protein [Cryomorphaceae bacterium]